jgi:hypothetical protein
MVADVAADSFSANGSWPLISVFIRAFYAFGHPGAMSNNSANFFPGRVTS